MGIMERNMETSIMGLYWDSGKMETTILGLCWDSEKNRSYHNGVETTLNPQP